MPARRILGGGWFWTRGVTFWPFLNSSSWWWLINSVFLIRTSCRKTTHANGYSDVWPGWAVSVSVLPLTHRWVRKLPRRRNWQPTPVFLQRYSHGQRSLVSYSPWGFHGTNITERLNMHAWKLWVSINLWRGLGYICIFMKGLEQERVQYRIGSGVVRVQALVHWS